MPSLSPSKIRPPTSIGDVHNNAHSIVFNTGLSRPRYAVVLFTENEQIAQVVRMAIRKVVGCISTFRVSAGIALYLPMPNIKYASTYLSVLLSDATNSMTHDISTLFFNSYSIYTTSNIRIVQFTFYCFMNVDIPVLFPADTFSMYVPAPKVEMFTCFS